MRRNVFLLLVVVVAMAEAAGDGLNVEALGGGAKKFFMDMTKKAMGVPSLKPENVAAQAFFSEMLNKYTKLDDNTKKDMLQHVPKVTKVFDAAAKKFNIEPMEAFKILSTFFVNFKERKADLLQTGLKSVGKLFQGH